jgi:hypothetical protein
MQKISHKKENKAQSEAKAFLRRNSKAGEFIL